MRINKIQTTNNLKKFIANNVSTPANGNDNSPYNKTATLSVYSSQARNYFPNIGTMSPEKTFTLQYRNAVELSDGYKLIRPKSINSETIEIKPDSTNGLYNIIFTSFLGGYQHIPFKRTISEEELKADKYLYAGQIKQIDEEKYEFTYHDENNSFISAILNRKECIELMQKTGDQI